MDEDESDAIVIVEVTDDELQELNDANDGLELDNLAANGGVVWCHETVTAMIQSEVQLYKAAKGMQELQELNLPARNSTSSVGMSALIFHLQHLRNKHRFILLNVLGR